MNKQIRVTGKAKISATPDMTRLTMELTAVKPSYDKAVKKSTEDMAELRECFKKLGFGEKALKTLSFNIDTKYESYRDKNDNWKRRFEGYEYSHNLKIEFPSDNKLLGKCLYALAKLSCTPQFRISFFVKDVDAVKNELLGKAVTDSKIKAEVLAKAAEVKLGDILSIDYSWGHIELYTEPIDKLCCKEEAYLASPDSYDIDIEADDINVTDTVTVVWEIK